MWKFLETESENVPGSLRNGGLILLKLGNILALKQLASKITLRANIEVISHCSDSLREDDFMAISMVEKKVFDISPSSCYTHLHIYIYIYIYNIILKFKKKLWMKFVTLV